MLEIEVPHDAWGRRLVVVGQRRARVAELTRAGMSAAQIAQTLGITTRAVERNRVRAGVAKPPPKPLTDDEIQRAQLLLDDGCSLQEVARTLGRSWRAVHKHFPEHGWTRAEMTAYLSAVRRFHNLKG